jgi:hypothetical protein
MWRRGSSWRRDGCWSRFSISNDQLYIHSIISIYETIWNKSLIVKRVRNYLDKYRYLYVLTFDNMSGNNLNSYDRPSPTQNS